jgi:hypothetical protein
VEAMCVKQGNTKPGRSPCRNTDGVQGAVRNRRQASLSGPATALEAAGVKRSLLIIVVWHSTLTVEAQVRP